MDETPDSIKIRMLADAGFPPTDLQEKYLKIVEFIKQLAHESVYQRYENLNEMNWDAFDLLKQIGELD